METLTLLDIIGSIIGLIYLWLEYKASIFLWIVGIIMPAVYMYIYYEAGLYADFGINVYYLIAAVYGLFVWQFGKKREQSADIDPLPVTHVSMRKIMYCTVIFIVLWLLLAWILIRFTNSTVPWIDSFVNAMSIIGMWLLACKYAEQWLVWIVVDALCCGLYFYKDLPFTAVLYGIYAIIAIFGYRKWLKMIPQKE